MAYRTSAPARGWVDEAAVGTCPALRGLRKQFVGSERLDCATAELGNPLRAGNGLLEPDRRLPHAV